MCCVLHENLQRAFNAATVTVQRVLGRRQLRYSQKIIWSGLHDNSEKEEICMTPVQGHEVKGHV